MKRNSNILHEYITQIIHEAHYHDTFDYIMTHVDTIIKKIETLLKAEYSKVVIRHGEIKTMALSENGYHRSQVILLLADDKRKAQLYVGVNHDENGNMRFFSHQQHTEHVLGSVTLSIRFNGKARSFSTKFVNSALEKNPKDFTEFINTLVYSKVKKHSEEKLTTDIRDVFVDMSKRYKGAKFVENYILNNTEYPIALVHKQFMFVPVMRRKQFRLSTAGDIKQYVIFISRKYTDTMYANNINTGKYKLLKLDKLKQFIKVARTIEELVTLCNKFKVKNDEI